MSIQGVYPLEGSEKQKVWRTREDTSFAHLDSLVQDKEEGGKFKGIAL
jgi:hypothetical protein